MWILDNSLSEILDEKSRAVAKVKGSVIPSCCHPESSLTALLLMVAVSGTWGLRWRDGGSLEGEDVINSPGCYFEWVPGGWIQHATNLSEEVFQGTFNSMADKCRGISFQFSTENLDF